MGKEQIISELDDLSDSYYNLAEQSFKNKEDPFSQGFLIGVANTSAHVSNCLKQTPNCTEIGKKLLDYHNAYMQLSGTTEDEYKQNENSLESIVNTGIPKISKISKVTGNSENTLEVLQEFQRWLNKERVAVSPNTSEVLVARQIKGQKTWISAIDEFLKEYQQNKTL